MIKTYQKKVGNDIFKINVYSDCFCRYRPDIYKNNQVFGDMKNFFKLPIEAAEKASISMKEVEQYREYWTNKILED